jgi:RNA binding exosome subunit
MGHLMNSLSDFDRGSLFRQVESRLDEELFFFIRIDKEKLIKANEFILTDEGNCYHIKLGVAAYPRKREIALGRLKEYFGKYV